MAPTPTPHPLQLLQTSPDMARARRLAPRALLPAHRAAVRDLEVHVEDVPPDALDRHRRLAALPVRQRAVCLARRRFLGVRVRVRGRWCGRGRGHGRGRALVAARVDAEVVMVDRLEVPAPGGVAVP